ncbi:MAG: hypothetical protein HP496_18345 [Nitrospira sp.]|nr:hypothetical protein [Nitrospira sp.]
MKPYLALPLIAIIASSLAGCAGAASPLAGGILTNVNYGGMATPAASANKEGKACASSILGIVATGDASVAAAKTAAGITTVASVDHSAFSVLTIYAEWCTIVKGS